MSINVKKHEAIAILQVNFFEDWARKLEVFLRKIKKDEKIRALILEFSDEENFSGRVKTKDLNEKMLFSAIKNFPVPIILIIKDSAKGYLFGIALASHLCIASDLAEFEIEKTENLKLQIGKQNSDKLNSTKNKINSEKASDLGFINKVVPPIEVEKAAFEMAQEIVNLAPLAIRSCLIAVNQGLEINLTEGLKLETKLFAQIFATEDMKEGTQAFLEKRKPNFQGK
jgi:enoyl-CoA hydratase